MRAFVTGATGFIGRRLLDRLLLDGWRVTAMVSDHAQSLPSPVQKVTARLESPVDSLASQMAGHDTLFHLAAKVSFDPAALPELMETNAEGTRQILEAAKLAKILRTVVVSSACTIGLSDRADFLLEEVSPLDESLPRRNPYMASKLAAEAHAINAAREGQHVVIVNPTTVFGPGDRTLNSGTLIRQVAVSRFVPLPPGGSNVIDIDDVVEGILAAADRGRSGARYILGGRNLTFREIITTIAGVIGRHPILVPIKSVAKTPMMAAAWVVGRFTGSRLITPQIIADTFAFKYFSSHRAELELQWAAQRDFKSTLAGAWDYYVREGLIASPAGAAA